MHDLCNCWGADGYYWKTFRIFPHSEKRDCSSGFGMVLHFCVQWPQIQCFLLFCSLLPIIISKVGQSSLAAYIFHLPLVPLAWHHGLLLGSNQLIPSLASAGMWARHWGCTATAAVVYAYGAGICIASWPLMKVFTILLGDWPETGSRLTPS